jgi:hypothetical protein
MYRARTSLAHDNDIYAYIDDEIIKQVSSTDTSKWQRIEVPVDILVEGDYNIGFGAMGIENTYGGFLDDVSLVKACVNND